MSGVSAVLLAATLSTSSPDPWFGADKVKHFFLSAFIQSVTYGALRATKASHRSSMYGATAASTALGIGKEVHDRRAGQSFSLTDLAWDAAGAGGVTLLLERTRRGASE